MAEDDGGWREVSWAEAGSTVDELANGLLALGVRKGDAFAILARTSLEWALFDFALALVGAVAAPIYSNSSARDCGYILEHSEAIGVLAEDEEQLAKIDPDGNARLEHVLSHADLPALRERGRAFAATNPGALDAACTAITEDDVYTYIYTSGTTGPPKACMITHRNYYAMTAKSDELDTHYEPDDLLLLYLPLAHNFGRLVHLSGAHVGYTIAFLSDPLRVREALLEVRPTLLPSVPRVFEKIHSAVLAQFDEVHGARRRLIDWALAVGTKVSRLRQAKQPVPPGLALRHRLAKKLVYDKVKARLGGRLRLANSGGAPLAREIAEFFHALDILIVEGYGLSECTTAVSVNLQDDYRFGTVGKPLPGIEVKIADDGEILVRSPDTIFAGYYKNEQATREILSDDGWLSTGDIGAFDTDGFLTITDRKKDIIVTAGGKNVAPQNLENELKTAKVVSQALVVGDRKPYIAALITLDPETTQGMSGEEQRAAVEEAVAAVNRDRSSYEQIKRFEILPRDFSMEENEITVTLKLRRKVCAEHFADELAALYA